MLDKSPNDIFQPAVDNYITNNNGGLATKEELNKITDDLGSFNFTIKESDGYMYSNGTILKTTSALNYHCKYTDKIPCKIGDTFYYEGRGENNAYSYLIYNGDDIVKYGQINGEGTITTDIICTSIVFSSYNGKAKEVVLKVSKKIKDTSIIFRLEVLEKYAPTKLNGKKLSLEGDSICYGAGFLGGYGKIIADKYNMELVNNAIAGGTIATVTDKHCICEGVELLPSDSDYIILEGGGNDASVGNKVPIGSLSDGFNAELDKTTYYGAFEYMLKQLTTRFHGKKYGYIACHTWAKKYSSFYNGSDNYYIASKKCCEKWGVPFLDLNVQVPPFNQLRDNDTYDTIRNLYTKNGDGTHPTEEGYKKYYVPKIEAWLNSL